MIRFVNVGAAAIIVLYNPTITLSCSALDPQYKQGVIGSSELYSVEYAWMHKR